MQLWSWSNHKAFYQYLEGYDNVGLERSAHQSLMWHNFAGVYAPQYTAKGNTPAV